MVRDLLAARFRSSHLATIPGLDRVADGDREALARVVRGTSLEAAPLLVGADGSLCLLAPLIEDAAAQLDGIALHLGGTQRDVHLAELAAGDVISASP